MARLRARGGILSPRVISSFDPVVPASARADGFAEAVEQVFAERRLEPLVEEFRAGADELGSRRRPLAQDVVGRRGVAQLNVGRCENRDRPCRLPTSAAFSTSRMASR